MPLLSFWKDDSGQDLIEYSLLLALICTASAALFMGQDQSIKNVWDLATNNLMLAAS